MKTYKFGGLFILGFALFPALNSFCGEPALPTDVTILTRQDFAGQNFYSVGDALESLTSFNFAKEGTRGSKITAKMRGAGSAKEILVLLDGKPLNTNNDGPVDLSQIPLNMVDRIEITRGGASSSTSAEAPGGAINILTSRPNHEGLQVDLGAGIARTGVKTSLGRFLGRSNLGDLTYLPSRQAAGGLQDNNETDSETHFGNISRSFNGKGYWGLEYYFQNSAVDLANGTPVPMSLWNGHLEQTASTPFFNSDTNFQQAKLILASPLIAGGTFYFDALKNWRKESEKDRRTGFLLSEQKVNSGTTDLKWKKGNFEIGGDLKNYTEERPAQSNQFKYQRGAFLSNKWEVKNWTFLPALRYDHLSNAKGIFNPRLVTIFSPGPEWIISGSAQKSFLAPTFDELHFSTDNSHNPGLIPETHISYDLGFAFRPNGHFKIGSTGFFKKGKDLILLNPVSHRLANFGRLESEGAETEMEINTGENNKFLNFSTLFNWTCQRSRRSRDNGAGFVATQMTPRHVLDLKLVQHLPKKTNLTNEVKYQSEQFQFDNEEGLRIPSHYVWNIRLQKNILAATIHLVVENVTSRRFTDDVVTFTDQNGMTSSAFVPQPGRTYWAGITIRFLD